MFGPVSCRVVFPLVSIIPLALKNPAIRTDCPLRIVSVCVHAVWMLGWTRAWILWNGQVVTGCAATDSAPELSSAGAGEPGRPSQHAGAASARTIRNETE